MKHHSTNIARFALTGVALAAGCLWSTQGWALGLGRLSVQSALGETLKAEIEISSITPEETSSLRVRIAPAEAYRAAGVEYNAVLPAAQVQVQRRPDGRMVLRLSSERAVLEPFVDVILEADWAAGRLVREYTMLFDPPGSRPAQAPVAAVASPVITPAAPAPPATAPAQPAPVPTPAIAAAPATPPAGRPAPAAPTRAPSPAVAAGPAPAATAAPGSVDEIRVRNGDTLSGIATRAQRPGVSLDQMLVLLFRANPPAFAGENMNRLKTGSVLSVPPAGAPGMPTTQEAREVIVAQSADFSAYRQRLASGTTARADDEPARQARGQVQAQVNDRKQSATPTPDKLTLSQGGTKASSSEARTSAETARKDSKERLAELSRNVTELKKLQGAAVPAAPAPAPAPVAAPAPVLVAPAPVAAPAAPVAPVTAPVVVATAPPAPAPAPAPPVAKPPAAKPAVPAPAAEEPGWIDSLMGNSLLLPFAGVLVALLAGLGLYRLRGRLRKPGGETSFLESRLQPDSFFGASGGQRIDTRDAGSSISGNSSSMSYSLSQLDAIGDVDPVAEADVYLAYGRDLQAEEILKEAMRATPDRMAIRTKLLEVYAKRRDAKGFELLASQVFSLSGGKGDDWSQAQVLGLGIDPENPLYQRGGQPEEVRGASGQLVEPLGASTVPYTAPVGPPAFQPAADATLDHDVDLDLDLELPAAGASAKPAAAPTPGETTHAFVTSVEMAADGTREADLPTVVLPAARAAAAPAAVATAAPADSSAGIDFDLGDLTVDTRPRAPSPAPALAEDSRLDFGDFSISSHSINDDTLTRLPQEGDALARKLDLAEEFRQIGDLEGARDLLDEVVVKADGALRAKAQTMLDGLG